jgi:hypothetical protein
VDSGLWTAAPPADSLKSSQVAGRGQEQEQEQVAGWGGQCFNDSALLFKNEKSCLFMDHGFILVLT